MRQELSVYLPACNGEKYRSADNTTDENLRSIEDIGYSEAAVFTSLSDYYDSCYEQIMQRGAGNYTSRGKNSMKSWNRLINPIRTRRNT